MDKSKGTGAIAEEARLITLAQLHAIRTRAHHLIDQMTAVVGYSQIALEFEPESIVQVGLKKIMSLAHDASKDIVCCIDSLNEVERKNKLVRDNCADTGFGQDH